VLSDDEAAVLRAIRAAEAANQGAPWFEADDRGVRQLGTALEVAIGAEREILRRLNHRGLLDFDRSKAPRWVFRPRPHATEFTA
jgi:hypothetical protein